MPQPFTDHELAQIDRAAERREARRVWDDEKPTKHTGEAAAEHPTAHAMPQRSTTERDTQ